MAETGEVSVCVPEPIVHTADMAYKNKKVVVQGLLTGRFCEGKSTPRTMGRGLPRRRRRLLNADMQDPR